MNHNEIPISDLIRMFKIEKQLGVSEIDSADMAFIERSLVFDWPRGHVCYYYLVVFDCLPKVVDRSYIRQKLEQIYAKGDCKIRETVLKILRELNRQETENDICYANRVTIR